MKAHGIEKSNGGGTNSAGASGPSTPTTPKTPATGRKNASSRTTPASKKRKVAARSDDVDEHDIKLDIKEEIKLEESTNAPNGSYIIDPNKPPPEASAAATHVKTPDDVDHEGENKDDVLLVSESRTENGTAPLACAHQVLLPPPPETFYGFVDPATNLHHPSQHQITATDVPIRCEYGHANYATQAMATLAPDGRHWLHHHEPIFFWSDAHLEPHVDIKHD